MWVKRILPAARLSQGFLYPQKHTLRYKYNQLSHRLIQPRWFSLHLWIWIKKEHVYTWTCELMYTRTQSHMNTRNRAHVRLPRPWSSMPSDAGPYADVHKNRRNREHMYMSTQAHKNKRNKVLSVHMYIRTCLLTFVCTLLSIYMLAYIHTYIRYYERLKVISYEHT